MCLAVLRYVKNGSYEVAIDLFSSKNDLVARHYDDLDQGGPDSNLVSVTFNDNAAKPEIAARISLYNKPRTPWC